MRQLLALVTTQQKEIGELRRNLAQEILALGGSRAALETLTAENAKLKETITSLNADKAFWHLVAPTEREEAAEQRANVLACALQQCQGKETVSGDPTTWGHEAIIDGQRQQIEGLEAEKQGMERRLVSIHEDYQTELKTAEAERNTLQRECDELKQVVAEQDLFESACAAAQRERDTLQQQINQLLKAGQCETVEELINTIENLLLEASY